MKPPIKIVLTLLCGTALGVALTQGLRAQSENKPAYVVAEVDVTDPQAFQAYAAKVRQRWRPTTAATSPAARRRARRANRRTA
jgi:c-di-GMP-binding flagellar brake protein YcgR